MPLIAAILILSGVQLSAQTATDTLEIKETVLNYLEGLETNSPERVEKAMHPDLAKRIIEKNEDDVDYPSDMTAASLIGFSKKFDFTLFYKADVDVDAPMQTDIQIYDVSEGIATVKAETNKFEFIDYIHLGKFDGEWKIVNILWAWTGSTNKWMNK